MLILKIIIGKWREGIYLIFFALTFCSVRFLGLGKFIILESA